jgi:hypothetical protein
VALDWSTVRATHVQRACEAIRAGSKFRDRAHGLVVYYESSCLPAKEVLRQAYRLANSMNPDAVLVFSSGDATLNTLRKLGFRAERLPSRK